MDTERFVSPEVAVLRNREYDSLEALLEKLKNHMDGLKSTTPNTPVNVARARILEDCLDAANWEPGLFRFSPKTCGLTVQS
jgi:CRISPR-associated endonuclease/helicase Cas3